MLKCFVGNYDGSREALVIASSQKKAAKVAGCGLKMFRDFYRQVEMPPIEREVETLYTRPFEYRRLGRNWELGRCKL